MRQHIITAAVVATAAVAASVGTHFVLRPAPQQVVLTEKGKPAQHAWGDLSQAEVDKLTSILKAKPSKQEVGIFCANKDCEDLATDFDNAFESAGWNSGIERPIADTNFGINVGPPDDKGKELASAIAAATNGRIIPGLLDAQILGENRLVLVISRKSRDGDMDTTKARQLLKQLGVGNPPGGKSR